MSITLSITQLAARAGIGPDTVRYYERTGLLPAPARTSGDHRRYDERALDRLRFIRAGKRLGLRLDSIGELLEVRDTGQCPCEPAAELLKSRLAEIDAEVGRLMELRGQLTETLVALTDPWGTDPSPCAWLAPEPGGR